MSLGFSDIEFGSLLDAGRGLPSLLLTVCNGANALFRSYHSDTRVNRRITQCVKVLGLGEADVVESPGRIHQLQR